MARRGERLVHDAFCRNPIHILYLPMPPLTHTGDVERFSGGKYDAPSRMGKVCNLTTRTITSAASVVGLAVEGKGHPALSDILGDRDFFVLTYRCVLTLRSVELQQPAFRESGAATEKATNLCPSGVACSQ
jgi:hypothetical protein